MDLGAVLFLVRKGPLGRGLVGGSLEICNLDSEPAGSGPIPKNLV